MLLAVVIAIVASVTGILLAYSFKVPSGPSIVLVAGVVYLISALLGAHGSVRARYFPFRHLEA
jgi:zinc/manganese transport system permease protein